MYFHKTSKPLSQKDSNCFTLVRFFSIILVVFLHAYNAETTFAGMELPFVVPSYIQQVESLISHRIGGTAVPTFFIISGYFAFRSKKTYSVFVVQKLRTLAIPYFFGIACGLLFTLHCKLFPSRKNCLFLI